jgi:hypothetical protein
MIPPMFKPRIRWSLAFAALAAVGLLSVPQASAQQTVRPPKVPANIKFSVIPESVSPGDVAKLTIELLPIDGVKINRYPKITVNIPAREGLVAEAKTSQGSDIPPPEDQLKSNYFKTLEPLQLTLEMDGAAASGKHELEGKLTYNYCMPANGFCARKRVPVTIPISVK